MRLLPCQFFKSLYLLYRDAIFDAVKLQCLMLEKFCSFPKATLSILQYRPLWCSSLDLLRLYRKLKQILNNLLYCCFSPPIGLSSLLFQLFCVEGGVIWHSQLLEVLIKPGLLQERGWKCLLGLLIALAGWNPFHSSWNVNCPFPFPSDQ